MGQFGTVQGRGKYNDWILILEDGKRVYIDKREDRFYPGLKVDILATKSRGSLVFAKDYTLLMPEQTTLKEGSQSAIEFIIKKALEEPIKGDISVVIYDPIFNHPNDRGDYPFIAIGKNNLFLQRALKIFYGLGFRSSDPNGPVYYPRSDGVIGAYYHFSQDFRSFVHQLIKNDILTFRFERLVSKREDTPFIERKIFEACVDYIRFT